MRSFMCWHIVISMSVIKPGVETHTCNLSTQKMGVGGMHEFRASLDYKALCPKEIMFITLIY